MSTMRCSTLVTLPRRKGLPGSALGTRRAAPRAAWSAAPTCRVVMVKTACQKGMLRESCCRRRRRPPWEREAGCGQMELWGGQLDAPGGGRRRRRGG